MTKASALVSLEDFVGNNPSWNPLREFFLNHAYGRQMATIGDKLENKGVIASWKEDRKTPLILASYQTQKGVDLYVEAFFRVAPPNHSTVLGFDGKGQVRLDATQNILDDAPSYYHPIMIPKANLSFLGLVPKLQKELESIIAKYK